MSKWIHSGCIALATGALLLGGCMAGTDSDNDESHAADATPSSPQTSGGGYDPPPPPPPEIGYVDLIPVRQAVCNGFGVKNVGNMPSATSTLRVKYSWRIGPGLYEVETQYFSVPALAAGAQASFSYYPALCFDSDGDCDFVMTVDNGGSVNESNENNNALTTSCTAQ